MNNSNVQHVSMSASEFNSKEALEMKQSRSGMIWTDKESGKPVILRTPLLEVVYPPQVAPGKAPAYSMSLAVHISDKNREVGERDSENFRVLGETSAQKAKEFLLSKPEHAKRFTKNTFSDMKEFDDKCKVATFWYPSKEDPKRGSFYMRFKPSVVMQLFDVKGSERTGKHVYKPIKDDPRLFLGPGSLITVDFKPNAFFYQTKQTLYPFSPEIENIIVWAYRENKDMDAKRPSAKKHGFLPRGVEGYSLKTPFGYRGYEMQMDIPIHDIDSYNVENMTLSQVIPGEKGPMIFARSGDSWGPVYFRGTGVIRYAVKKDPTYGSRNVTFAEEEANQHIHRVTRGVWDKLMDVIVEDSEKIFGEKYSLEVINDICRPPLYSQNDAEQTNPRVNMKLPLEEKSDKPLFDLYVLKHPTEENEGEEGAVELVEQGETCDEAEKLLTPGTTVQYVVMARPVIVGTSVYWSYRVSQVMVDPEQDRVVAPPLSGFAFPGFENAEVEIRSSKVASVLDEKSVSFTKPDKNKDGRVFYQTLANGSNYLILPECTVAYDIGLVNNPENDEYGYRTRHNLSDQDPQDETMFRAVEAAHLKHATENSPELFGGKKPKSEAVVKATFGSFIKYGKKDDSKNNPYWTTRTPVYENNHGGVDIAFEAYRLIPSVTEGNPDVIQKIDLHQPEDLLKVLHQGARVRMIATQKTWLVDGRLKPSFSLAQVLLLPAQLGADIPFVDVSSDMVSISNDAYAALKEEVSTEEKQIELSVDNETVANNDENVNSDLTNNDVASNDPVAESTTQDVTENQDNGQSEENNVVPHSPSAKSDKSEKSSSESEEEEEEDD